jgi:hypothetical protein
MTADAGAADLFLSMMRQVLPVQGDRFMLDLDEGPAVEQEGWLSAPVVAGLLDETGELMEAQTGAVTLLHLVDVGDARGRAFLTGWKRALERLASPFDSRELLARAHPLPMRRSRRDDSASSSRCQRRGDAGARSACG